MSGRFVMILLIAINVVMVGNNAWVMRGNSQILAELKIGLADLKVVKAKYEAAILKCAAPI